MNIIKVTRKKRGFSQQTFAEALGISPGHMGDIERGARRPSLGLAARMEAVLGMPGIVQAVVAEKTAEGMFGSQGQALKTAAKA